MRERKKSTRYGSCKKRRAARLYCLDLGGGQRGSPEATGQVVAVKVLALGGGDRAQLVAGGAANAALRQGLDGLAQGTKLLGVVAVGTEGLVRGDGSKVRRQVLGWAGRVWVAGSMVNGCGKD